jgi:hypothetical protein
VMFNDKSSNLTTLKKLNENSCPFAEKSLT